MLWAVLRGYSIQRALKITDVLLICTQRYDKLWEIRIVQGDAINGKLYWQSYWSLQFTQYSHWLNGFIDERTMKFWLESRKREFAVTTNETDVGGIGYRDAWQDNRGSFDVDFGKFIDKVHTDGAEIAMRRAR